MTSPVITVTTRTLVRRAAALMTGRSIGSLVVTSANGKVAGIVTVADLLEQMASGAGPQIDPRSSPAQCEREERVMGRLTATPERWRPPGAASRA